MATLFKSDGTILPVYPTPPSKEFTLPELHLLIEGPLEAYRLPGNRWFVCNEDGKRLELPHNLTASQIFATYYVPDVVVGNVLLATTEEMGGEF